MSKKILTFAGLFIVGLLVIVGQFQRSKAQTTIQPLKIADISSVSSSNPAANYPTNADGAIQNDNGGISLWTGNFPTPYTECGHLGIQASNPVVYTTTDPAVANVWQRRAACNGYVAVGGASGDQYAEQTLSLAGTTLDGKTFTLNVEVPVVRNIHGNMRLYIDDTGATYHCRADHDYGTLRYPNDCDLTLEQALKAEHLARAGSPAVAGNGLCQTGESPYTAPQDCGNPKTFSGRATFQTGDAGGSVETNGLIKQKVINLQNTGSHADTFRTTLPINPETRCGLRGSTDSYPENRLPNTLPITLDTPLGVGETKYIVAVCVTNGLQAAPFTWSYKTVSVGALNVNRADVNPLIADVQDTVNITIPLACGDSDGGMNSSIKGVGTGTYAGAISSYIRIYGQEPDPTYSKPTTEKFSTFIDHCATTTQLNEAFCDANGKLQAIGLACPNGCSNGVCITAPPPPPPPSSPSDPSLVGYWKFDGNGNNEVAGGPAAVTVGNAVFNASGGKLGGYLYVQTNTDYAKIPYASIFDLPDSFTIELWFRQRANRSFLQDLIYKGTPINNYNFRIFRQLWNENNFGPIIAGHTAANTGYWTQPSNPNQLAHNTWHHVVFTKGPSMHAYYLDGVLIGSKNAASTYDSQYFGPAKTPHNDIIVGDSAVDTDIDNLRIYNRALTQSEVSENSGFPPPAPPAPTPSPTPGAGAPEPQNDDVGVWAQVDVATGQIENSALCQRSVCGINGEYHGYVPPPTWPSGSIWWPTSKRYIWQLPGQAGYGSGNFNFNTYVFTVTGGTIYNGIFTPAPSTGSTTTPGSTTLPSVGTSTPPSGTTTPPAGTSSPALPVLTIPPGLAPQLPPGPLLPNFPIPPGTSTAPFIPGTSTPVLPLPPPFSTNQCKTYLSSARRELKNDKQYWRDTNRELSSVKSTYDNAPQVKELLSQAQKTIFEIEKMVRHNKCDQNTINTIQEKLDGLHGDIFFELDGYVTEMDDIFEDQFESQPIPTVPASPELDRNTKRVLEQLGTHVDQLSQNLEKNQKQIDELVGQVAQLNTTLEHVTQTASEVSEKIVISYKALSRMQNQFETERQQILADKDRLIAVVGEAMNVLKEKACVNKANREDFAEGLGKVATINWVEGRAEALEKKLRIMIASCRAQDLTANDINAFSANLNEAERTNLADSCSKGLTPFCDVPTDAWFYGAMITGHETGFITKGMPGENVLKQDALLMMLRAYGMTDSQLVGECAVPALPSKLSMSPYAQCAITRALEKGLAIKGNMRDPATRIELASWINALSPLSRKAGVLRPYTDLGKISPEEKEAVEKIVSNEIMVGHPEKHTFGPFENVTRAALAVALEKVLSVQGQLP